MKMSCEFHLKMLFSLLQRRFEAVLIELLTLLLAFLVVLLFLLWWLVSKTEFFCVNDVQSLWMLELNF